MSIIALEPYDIHIWADKADRACQRLWDDADQWLKNEVRRGFMRQDIHVAKGCVFTFTGKITHAGAGLKPNFRLFVASSHLPEPLQVYGELQSYFQLVEPDEKGTGAYVPYDTWLTMLPTVLPTRMTG